MHSFVKKGGVSEAVRHGTMKKQSYMRLHKNIYMVNNIHRVKRKQKYMRLNRGSYIYG